MDTLLQYEQKKNAIVQQMKQASEIRLEKKTSNLFRSRTGTKTRLDVKSLNQVISIDRKKMICVVEGMTTYETLVNETLKYGVMPVVVPELKSITIGGAATGIGIESSSFKYGLVHETIEEMEILLGNGEVIVCNKNRNKALFFGFPNSYGSVGYALKLKIKVTPVKKYVKIEHTKFTDFKSYFAAVQKSAEEKIDFLDGTIFNEHEMYVTKGTFTDQARSTSNYKYLNIYYRSIQKKKTDYLTTRDYIWRWDPDWFWCSKHFRMQNLFVRILLGKFFLKSTTYWKIMFWNRKYQLTEKFGRKERRESIIQDVEIPIEHCEQFMQFFTKNIGITPVWMCPLQTLDQKRVYPLYAMNPKKLYVNFGFWDTVKTTQPEGYYNKLIEKKVEELHGKKSLYSDVYYSKEKFWQLYNKKAYDQLKRKYDPQRRLKDLYEKVVKKQ